LGQVPDAGLPALYRNARALLFTGEEDFGLTPLEAQATGRPVIALARGGALETVTPRTGLFFETQTAAALATAVRTFDAWERDFSPGDARANALRFGKERFHREILAEVQQVMSFAREGQPQGGRAA